ncbi:hypothetical protein JAAARDRAFT_27641 [Jaapia argillacea MUCL 33604]|uniref:F-box domain-containing protein n=1 Tax=Jaapia argillacea MUCL 33604 TaxID=933084 RepID=A0A067QAK6_9AGAM|nr:hypothetical protein JAAARDRAFT_27641 [Jaapia argillacea MUCL 33604]
MTGRSLSLVSRYIRDASHTTRYQSVTIKGLAQLRALNLILRRLSPAFRHVRHLLVSACASRNSYENKTSGLGNPLHRNEPEVLLNAEQIRRMLQGGEIRLRLEEAQKASFKFNETLYGVLSLLSGTLETLSFTICNRFRPPPFPALKELTICGLMDDSAIPASLPSLRRLHLVGPYYNQHEILTFLRGTPLLTHLRLSGLEKTLNILHLVESILGEPDGTPHPFLREPLPLEQVLIQCRRPLHGYGSADGDYASKVRVMHMLVDIHPDKNILLLPTQAWHEDIDLMVSEEMVLWRDRMDGGEGCWDTRWLMSREDNRRLL